jgi:hypothetical protein
MSETTPDEPYPYLTAHVAKLAFLALLPIFAEHWSQARETALPDSLNAALWPDYERVLRACQEVLSSAPMHPNECKQFDIEAHFTRAVERLATTLASVLPGGLEELKEHLITDEIREMRRKRVRPPSRKTQPLTESENLPNE